MILAAIQPAQPAPAPASDPLEGLRGNLPPVDVPWPPWVWWAIGIGAAIALGLLAWLVVWWVRRKPAQPPPTPRTLAVRALEELRGQVRECDAYTFSIRVSDVLRTFVAGQFGIQATKQTSPEFLASIAGSPKFSGGDRTLLAAFLERCDMVKFARIATHAGGNLELLDSAMAFVQGTQA